jgi:hypothetical protein
LLAQVNQLKTEDLTPKQGNCDCQRRNYTDNFRFVSEEIEKFNTKTPIKGFIILLVKNPSINATYYKLAYKGKFINGCDGSTPQKVVELIKKRVNIFQFVATQFRK